MNEITDSPGYIILENYIDEGFIDSINEKLDTLYPVRASSSNLYNKQYAEKDDIDNLPDMAVWWSQHTHDWPDIISINIGLMDIVKKYMPDAIWQSSDIVTMMPGLEYYNPHVDTPHRFDKWNEDERLLGIQCIVALQDMTPDTGVTGIVPDSHQQDWDINECYSGTYNKYFMDKYVQNTLTKGSVLMYNARLLHSGMSNYLPDPRPALLMNYLSGSISDEIKEIDNVWKSNED